MTEFKTLSKLTREEILKTPTAELTRARIKLDWPDSRNIFSEIKPLISGRIPDKLPKWMLDNKGNLWLSVGHEFRNEKKIYVLVSLLEETQVPRAELTTRSGDKLSTAMGTWLVAIPPKSVHIEKKYKAVVEELAKSEAITKFLASLEDSSTFVAYDMHLREFHALQKGKKK